MPDPSPIILLKHDTAELAIAFLLRTPNPELAQHLATCEACASGPCEDAQAMVTSEVHQIILPDGKESDT